MQMLDGNKYSNKLQHMHMVSIKVHTQTKGSYLQVSNIRRTPVGNYIVDHSAVVGASPVGAAPTTSSFST